MAQTFKTTTSNSSTTFTFADTIMDSMRSHECDYVFKISDFQEVLDKCRAENISVLYHIKTIPNKPNEIDYIALTPVKFFGINGWQAIEQSELPRSIKWKKLPKV